MLQDLKLFKVYLESQQKDFTELICYLIDAAIYVHQNKLGDNLILPSNLGINTDDFFSQVEFPSQAMLQISQPISDCVDAIHREAERALKSMLMHLCDKKLQIVVNSNKESSGGQMLMAFLRGYGTITMVDKSADMDRVQKLDFGTDDPQQLFHKMNDIYDRHADWQATREEQAKMHILAKLNKPSIPGGYQNMYKDFATSLTVLDPHLSNKTLIELQDMIQLYWKQNIQPTLGSKRKTVKSIQQERYGNKKQKKTVAKKTATKAASAANDYICFECGDKKHTFTNCKQLSAEHQKLKDSGHKMCNKCGKDHYTKNCPQLQKQKAVAKAVTAQISNLEIETSSDKGPPSCSEDSFLDADVDDDWLDDDLLE